MSARWGAALLAAALVGCGAAPTSEPAPPAAFVGSVPPAPVPGRMLNAAVWTGAEMLVWGGVGQRPDAAPAELADGAAYDPAEETWRPLAPSPLSARLGMATVWAEDLLFVWGGSAPYTSEAEVFDDGATYDPAADTWARLPPSPLGARTGADALWTGSEIVVWGGAAVPASEQQLSDGAAFDPATGVWRRISSAPLPDFYEFGTVWTGTELVVLAGAFDSADHRPAGAAYDLAAQRWRVIAEPPLSQGYAQDLGWDGTEVVAAYPVQGPPAGTDGGTTAAAYDPAADTWRELPRIATEPSWSVPIWTGDAMVFWDAAPAGGAAYLAAEESWVELPAVDGAYREFPSLVWTGSLVIAWGGNDNCEATAGGGAADCTLDLLADGHTLRLDQGAG